MPARALRWYDVPVSLALLFVATVPLASLFGGRVAGDGTAALLVSALLGGACFAVLDAVHGYYLRGRARADLLRAAPVAALLGAIVTAAWVGLRG